MIKILQAKRDVGELKEVKEGALLLSGREQELGKCKRPGVGVCLLVGGIAGGQCAWGR